jgi:hypothetical protein
MKPLALPHVVCNTPSMRGAVTASACIRTDRTWSNSAWATSLLRQGAYTTRNPSTAKKAAVGGAAS